MTIVPPEPLLVDVFPQVTRVVARILVDLGEPGFAERLLRQRFHGRCDCSPNCRFVLSAPPGSSGSGMIWLEVGGEIVGEVSLDPTRDHITNFEISDCKAAGVPADWLSAGL